MRTEIQPIATAAPTRILLADDQGAVLEALRLLLKQEGYEADAVTRPAEVLSALEARDYDLLLMDLNYTQDTTSGREGLELLARIRKLHKDVRLVVMTAWGNMELAIEAMRQGARDFIQKPWNNQQVLETVRQQMRERSHPKPARQWEDEMAEAREVQQHFLARQVPEIEGCGIYATTRAARTLSGDYFAVNESGEKEITMCVADVAGKGTGAALLISGLQAMLQSLVRANPAATCEELNRVLCHIVPPGRFVSLFICRLKDDKRLVYCNAGHNPPILVRHDGGVQRLESDDAVLGYFRDWHYGERTLELRSGDRLVLFTDGMVEAFDEQGQEFGDQRLVALAAENRAGNAERLHRRLSSAMLQHCDQRPQDDATLVVLAVE